MKTHEPNQEARYAVYNWKTGELMDYDFNPVSPEEAELYEDEAFAREEIDSRGEPFCKVIDIADLEMARKITEAYNELNGTSLHLLSYGQKFRVLQKGWEGRVFIYEQQKYLSKSDSLTFPVVGGGELTISGNLAASLKVEPVD